jgi:peptidoglycan hydrolase CwlO-like protein
MKNLYDYMIARYGNTHEQSNLYELIQKLDAKINILEEKYNSALEDIKRLEEENVETTNTLYEIMHSVDAVDARIDIVADDWGDQFNG